MLGPDLGAYEVRARFEIPFQIGWRAWVKGLGVHRSHCFIADDCAVVFGTLSLIDDRGVAAGG